MTDSTVVMFFDQSTNSGGIDKNCVPTSSCSTC